VEQEDRFVASIAKLDGKPKFLHNSFKLGSDSLSQVSGKKLTTKSLLLSKEKERDFKKSYDSNIESKKKSDRISGPESNSIEGKKLKRKGAYEVNKEKVSDWDSTIQSRRLAKSYDFTNHKSSKPLATIEESGKKFKIGTPLEAEISKLLHGEQSTTEKNPFFKDHSRDLKAARQHLAEISKARWMARQKDAKDKYQSKIKSKRYRRALRKRKQEQEKSANVDDDGEADQKAEFDRVKERADLRHKTISKKLRFYDNTNSKESLVRKSQNLESQRLKTKRTVDESSSDEEDKKDPKDKASGDNDDVEIFKSVVKPSKSSKEQIFKSIDPNNFVQSTIKSVDEFKDSEDEEEDEQDEFDIATVDSGIELEKKNEKKELKVLPGWGSWSSEVPKVKKFKQKKKPSKMRPNLVMKDGRVGISQHQLGQVPHPFKSFDDCQSEMSQPVGDTFVPKTAVVKAIKPKVHVKLGAMLAPDSKDEMY